ncbi:MAG: HD domain-containing phosphohydrolase [Myxococcota bacterium]|nr:HD domain-containing phosphohydrolase [Myxococcota bacterium]
MGCSERILFVDDDPLVRTAFARSLRTRDFNVELAEGAEHAITLAGEREYAVIVTDYRMPRTNGLELVGILEKQQPCATYVLVSGECDLGPGLSGGRAGGDTLVSHIISKPWDTDELVTLLMRCIEAYRERRVQALSLRAPVVRPDLRKVYLKNVLKEMESNLSVALRETMGNFSSPNQRVVKFADTLARTMGAGDDVLLALEKGAILHDAGKRGIPKSILLGPDPLSDEEWDVMRAYPVLMGKLLEGDERVDGAREVVVQHHERWDGAGYPAALKGEEISEGARIFAVADAFDAIISERPYRPASAIASAIRELIRCSGTQFDPRVVRAVSDVPESQWESIAREWDD